MFLSWGMGTTSRANGIEVVCDGVVCSASKTVFSGVCCDLWLSQQVQQHEKRRTKQTGWSREGGRGGGRTKIVVRLMRPGFAAGLAAPSPDPV